MNAKKLLNYTLVLSIYIQVITFIIGLFALLIKIPTDYVLIKELFYLELIVQVVEGIFYIWLAFNIKKVINITPHRYMDWAITTPTMLITLISYLLFLEAKSKNSTHNLNLSSIFKSNFDNGITWSICHSLP